jgi:hypothetical protein
MPNSYERLATSSCALRASFAFGQRLAGYCLRVVRLVVFVRGLRIALIRRLDETTTLNHHMM